MKLQYTITQNNYSSWFADVQKYMKYGC